jgi:hypothetical protein
MLSESKLEKALYIQGVSKIHGITSGNSSSLVDNKNNLYQQRSGKAIVLEPRLSKTAE